MLISIYVKRHENKLQQCKHHLSWALIKEGWLYSSDPHCGRVCVSLSNIFEDK
jgi:hypothetical protein